MVTGTMSGGAEAQGARASDLGRDNSAVGGGRYQDSGFSAVYEPGHGPKPRL